MLGRQPEIATVQRLRQLGAALAVPRVVNLVDAHRVVEQREEEDDKRLRAAVLGNQSEADFGDRAPVLVAVHVGLVQGRPLVDGGYEPPEVWNRLGRGDVDLPVHVPETYRRQRLRS